MRVPKGTAPREVDAVDHEWELRVAEAKARLQLEEREWQAQMERAKRTLAAAEESEWQALQLRVAEAARSAEEREWQACIARAKQSARAVTPIDPFASSAPRSTAVAPRTRAAQRNVVYWP